MTCPNCTGTTSRSSSSGCGCDIRSNGLVSFSQPTPGVFVPVIDSTLLDAEVVPDGQAVALAENVVQVGLDNGRGNETIIDATAATTEQVYPGLNVDTRFGGGVTNIPNGDGWWSPKYGHPVPHYESSMAAPALSPQIYGAFADADPSGAFVSGASAPYQGAIPVDGVYLVTTQALWTGVTPGDRAIILLDVGGKQRSDFGIAANDGSASARLATQLTASAGDVITLRFGGGGGTAPGTFAAGEFAITYIASPHHNLWRP